ncbi:hypothetical protein [Rhodobacter maris]|uniref:Uncharacterized protein n=1 Tax=Rhodobacter maris TaxID=446682 RepID=A0A285TBR9_9RHOB|nr:hypothetical protein [Rhodobacter maris]SOC19562.1 hypothetical protein SAMN05877831_11812 [Rhodobacter maris]
MTILPFRALPVVYPAGSHDVRTAILAEILVEVKNRRPHWIGGEPQPSDLRGIVNAVRAHTGADEALIRTIWSEVTGDAV